MLTDFFWHRNWIFSVMKKIIAYFILFYFGKLNAAEIKPRKEIRNIKLSITDLDMLQVNGYNTIKLDFTKGIKEKYKTAEGTYKGARFWKNFDIQVSNGKIIDGYFKPDYSTLNDSGKVIFTISNPNSYEKSKIETVFIPTLKSIKIKPLNTKNIGIGSNIQINLQGEFNNGKIYEFNNEQNYLGLKTKDYTLYADGIAISDYHYTISNDLNNLKRFIHLRVVNNYKPNISHQLKIPIDYNIVSYSNYNGWKGKDGWSGNNGRSYCNGTNGENGQDGNDGENGENAKSIIIIGKTFMLDSFLMVAITIKRGTQTNTLIANTAEGKIIVTNSGGNGGDGGRGGDGGDASFSSSSKCSSGRVYGGDAGNGGNGGRGGNGGDVLIYTDSISQPFIAKVLQIVNNGGKGGNGGSNGLRGSGEDKADNKEKVTFLSVLLGGIGTKGSRGRYGEGGGYGQSGFIEWKILSTKALNELKN